MDITRRRGDTCADSFTITNRTTGLPTDLTGASFLMTLDITHNPTSNATNTYQVIGVVTLPQTGVVEFSPTLTQANQIGTFYYDIQMTDQQGKIRTISEDYSKYVYVQDITK